MGSIWGNAIKLSLFGESHGAGIGVVIDGFPSGVAYDEAFIPVSYTHLLVVLG